MAKIKSSVVLEKSLTAIKELRNVLTVRLAITKEEKKILFLISANNAIEEQLRVSLARTLALFARTVHTLISLLQKNAKSVKKGTTAKGELQELAFLAQRLTRQAKKNVENAKKENTKTRWERLSV